MSVSRITQNSFMDFYETWWKSWACGRKKTKQFGVDWTTVKLSGSVGITPLKIKQPLIIRVDLDKGDKSGLWEMPEGHITPNVTGCYRMFL